MKLRFSDLSARQYKELESDASKVRVLKAVRKTLGLMEVNLRHPSLNTHIYRGLSEDLGEKVFEAYAQQNTSRAYRILWHYGPGKDVISIVGIIPHP